MNWLDIIILVTLLLAVVAGLSTGAIRGLINLVGLVVGVVLAGRFYSNVAGWLAFIHNANFANVVGFGLILVFVIVIAEVVGMLLHNFVSGLMLGWLNRLIGGLLGLLVGAITWGAILTLWIKFSSNTDAVSASVLAKIMLHDFPLVLDLLPSSFSGVKSFFS